MEDVGRKLRVRISQLAPEPFYFLFFFFLYYFLRISLKYGITTEIDPQLAYHQAIYKAVVQQYISDLAQLMLLAYIDSILTSGKTATRK